MKYVLDLTDKQKGYIDNTITAYNELYNIFATNQMQSKGFIEQNISKFLESYAKETDSNYDAVASEEYARNSLMEKFLDNYKFSFRDEKYRNGHYLRLDVQGVKIFSECIYIPGLGYARTNVHKAYDARHLRAIRFDRIFNDNYTYSLTLKYKSYVHQEPISQKYFAFGQDMRIHSGKGWKT